MIVIDASVGVKWIQIEDYTDVAYQLLEDHQSGKNSIMVPNLFFLECANTLTAKSHTTEDVIRKDLNQIIAAELKQYEQRPEDLITASVLAKHYKTSVYDMLYAVIAKRLKVPMITADANFLKKTHFPFVKLISEI